MNTYYLPPILKKFRQSFPRVNFNHCAYFTLPEELRSGIINLAFLITDTFRATDLVAESLQTLSLAVVTSPDHSLYRTCH